MHLLPIYMNVYGKQEDLDNAVDCGMMDCIECGACTYICPARLPLIHAFRMGKQKVNNARMAAKAKAEAEKALREEGGVSNDGLQKFEADRILLSPYPLQG